MKILVVYYSMYGHVLQLARAVAQGAESVAGVDVMTERPLTHIGNESWIRLES